MLMATDNAERTKRAAFRPTDAIWREAVSMLCEQCRYFTGCEVIEGMIEMKDGGPWPKGGWVTDPGAGITCLSYRPRDVRTLQVDELEDSLDNAVEMCDGCAARKGTDASLALHTQRDFRQAVRGRGIFTCHSAGNKGKPCGGWCNAIKRQRMDV